MKNILFLCVANSARSQMAEGLGRAIFKGSANVFSAGSSPASVNPYAVRVMAEIGIDLNGHISKSIDNINVAAMDIIITLCSDEICPIVSTTAIYLHWPLTDPASDDSDLTDADLLTRFRKARDDIRQRLKGLDLTAS